MRIIKKNHSTVLYKTLFAAFSAAFLFLAFSCKRAESPQAELIFGTICSINAYEDGTKAVYDEIFARLRSIDALFSTTKPSSEIEKINAAAGVTGVEVSEEVIAVLKVALAFSRITDGAFDPTIGPVVKLWGINTEHERIPEKEELDGALKLVGWKNVKIDGNTVFLPEKGMRLDLGGIVKGYAADAVTHILKDRKVACAVIDLGGNVYVWGQKKDKSLWRVGIKNPNDPEGEPKIVLSLPESTVVTSGVYERYFIEDGVRYHHIINPKTGYPENNELTSVSVICRSSIAADALSTSLFILGKEKGFQLIDRIVKSAASAASKDSTSDSASDDEPPADFGQKTVQKKDRVSDGMGMWLFNGVSGEEHVLDVLENGLPLLPPMKDLPPLGAVFIDAEGKIFATDGFKGI
ncbi:FAD:protein FMN transferase [Treponema parvum]|uniref:FAD:protein FMN transferase n=1 Tax=Treponema parvum TaxID=138851 RepID=A0A975IBP4_9SPIR|nr:FAD:protein FMN transferase [Treponema parvum]QTQ11023.1 FAD:protein FMN transferase [Treponema parvum]QTQ17032.1 FAD:protein FMN transferase [Treponema parvum]